MKSSIQLRQPLMSVLIGLLLGLQYNQPSRAYMILLVTFIGMFIISFVWAFFLSRNILLHRETPLSWVQVGDHMEERLTLSNRSWLPAPSIELSDFSNLPGFNASRNTSIGPRGVDEWTVTAFCTQRGLFHLGDAEIITGDPLGIFEITIHAPLQAELLVLPQPSILPELGVSPAGMLGESQPRRNAPHQSIHVATVREFAEGDGMRMIHWPTTARKNKTFVRLMENAPEGNWWIVLDLDQKYMLGSGWDSIEEQSVSLAASLADLGLRTRKSTGLINNGQDFGWLPPQKGDAQQWQILQALALARPGGLSLAGMFDKVSASLGNHHSLLIVTACTEVDWIKSLPSLIKRGLIPTVFLMDPSRFNETEHTESIDIVSATLARQNVRHHIIPRGLIEPPRMKSVPLETWAWEAGPASHAVPAKNP